MLRAGHRNARGSVSTAPAVAAIEPVQAEDTELGILDRLGSVILLRRDSALFREGDAASCYYKVVSGAVRSCKLLADGRRHIIIGLDALKTYSCTAEAVDDATLVCYERRAIDALILQSPRVGQFLLSRVCAELSEARCRMLMLGRMSARERLASFLLRIAARSHDRDRDTIPLPMTRSDIGDHLGLRTETVCRTFADLKNAGLIEAASPHELRVLQRQALLALAQGV